MLPTLDGWAAHFLDHPEEINFRGYQSYIVLSLCRILYTLKFGSVVLKPTASQWAKETLEEKWLPLIVRAWIGRQNGYLALEPEDVQGTLDFIRYSIAYSQQFNRP